MSAPILAVDFGTSNTAAAVLGPDGPRLLSIEGSGGGETLPTAIFLDFDRRETLIGEAAIAALVEGREGRFMRALKSVLGTTLFHERRQFLNERLTLSEIVTRFLVTLRARAEAAEGVTFRRVLSGRPVHFHSRDPGKDAQAEADLEACYRAAGFEEVSFLLEPEAAARAAGLAPGLGLVVDIGGGTSDFSVFRTDRTGFEVLASHGIRLGGTDFDRTLSLARVMPLLGKGTTIRAELGPARHEAPNAIFHDLATWSRIPFLYTPQTRREVALMARLADRPRRFRRLVTVLEEELGHDIAFAVEAGKIAANGGTGGAIGLGMIETGLAAPLDPAGLGADLAPSGQEIAAAALECVAAAGVAPHEIDRAVLVGGSSLLSSVVEAVTAALPRARLERGEAFTAIIDGLARATAER